MIDDVVNWLNILIALSAIAAAIRILMRFSYKRAASMVLVAFFVAFAFSISRHTLGYALNWPELQMGGIWSVVTRILLLVTLVIFNLYVRRH